MLFNSAVLINFQLGYCYSYGMPCQ